MNLSTDACSQEERNKFIAPTVTFLLHPRYIMKDSVSDQDELDLLLHKLERVSASKFLAKFPLSKQRMLKLSLSSSLGEIRREGFCSRLFFAKNSMSWL